MASVPTSEVINFILKENFASFITEVEMSQPEDGGFATNEIETTFVTIGNKTRFNVDVEAERATRLTENERSIISPDSSLVALDGMLASFGRFCQKRTAGGQFDMEPFDRSPKHIFH